jgi:predicted HicB family RNase H-like nuclease
MTLMRHGDYVARITYDEEIDSFFGEVINTSDGLLFTGSQSFNLRLSPDDHARVAAAAAAAGKSMNTWVVEVLAKAAERELAG